MKKLLLCLACIAINFTAMAQQKEVYDLDLSFYEGKWVYENENTNEVFVVVLKQISCYIADEGPITCIIGAYKYTKDNNIIIDCTDILNTGKTKDDMPIFAFYTPNDPTPNILTSVVKDINHYKTSSASIIEIISKNPKQLKWILNEPEGDKFYLPGQPQEIDGFSIPSNVILTKIEE